MKQEQGFVMGVKDGIAHIKVGRHEDCTGCGGCPSSRQVMVDAVNEIGAAPGQHVRFEMREEHVLVGAFVVFLMPLIAAGLGAWIGWQAGMMQGWEETRSIAAGSVAFFLLSLVGVKLFDKKVARDRQMKPVIVDILQ